jgi:hypothetical protein
LQLDSTLAESKAKSKAKVRVVTESTFQLAMFWLKAVAELSMPDMVITRAVFHNPTFWLKVWYVTTVRQQFTFTGGTQRTKPTGVALGHRMRVLACMRTECIIRWNESVWCVR